MILVVIKDQDPGASHESAISLEADLHVIVTGGPLEASHVIVTGNPEVDHVMLAEGLDHVSVLVDGVGHHVTEIDEAGHVINAGGVDRVIASGEVDHVKDTEEIGTHAELAIDMIEGKFLVLIIRIMKAVDQKSEFYINVFCHM